MRAASHNLIRFYLRPKVRQRYSNRCLLYCLVGESQWTSFAQRIGSGEESKTLPMLSEKSGWKFWFEISDLSINLSKRFSVEREGSRQAWSGENLAGRELGWLDGRATIPLKSCQNPSYNLVQPNNDNGLMIAVSSAPD